MNQKQDDWNSKSGPVICVEQQSYCPVCLSNGSLKYAEIGDKFFNTPGVWNIYECRNEECGCLWLNPRPTRDDIAKAYQSYYTHGHINTRSPTKRAIRYFSLHRSIDLFGTMSKKKESKIYSWLISRLASLYPGLIEHLDLMIRYLPRPSSSENNLLDIGCGDGEAAEILQALGWNVVGLEIDQVAAETARRRGLKVVIGTVETTALTLGSFDAVTSSHVIEHVHDPLAFIYRSQSLLREGGKMVIVTPNAHAATHKKYGCNWRGLEPPRHLTIFTARSLERLAIQAKLRNVQVQSTARAVALAESASRAVQREGHYSPIKIPAKGDWITAQVTQWWAGRLIAEGKREGEELVLIAEK